MNVKKKNIWKWPGVPLQKISGSLLSDLLELEFIFLFVTLCSKPKLPAEGILGANKAGRGSRGGVGWGRMVEGKVGIEWPLCGEA